MGTSSYLMPFNNHSVLLQRNSKILSWWVKQTPCTKTLWIPTMNWSPFTDTMYSACKYIVNERWRCMTRNHVFHQTLLKLMLIRGGSRVFRRGGLSTHDGCPKFFWKDIIKLRNEKKSILVGCVPPACQPYVLRWPPDVITGGELHPLWTDRLTVTQDWKALTTCNSVGGW